MDTTTTTTTLTCSECSKTFDSERGLKIHAGRTKHDPAPARVEVTVAVEPTPITEAPSKRARRTPAEKVEDGKAANRTPCECGCGGTPKGRKSRFLPGHDAKHYGRIKRENGIAK